MKTRARYRVEASGRPDEYHWQVRRLGDGSDAVVVGLYHTRKRAMDIKADLEGLPRPSEAA